MLVLYPDKQLLWDKHNLEWPAIANVLIILRLRFKDSFFQYLFHFENTTLAVAYTSIDKP